MLSEIKVSPSPHISGPFSTRIVMLDVLIGLLPAVAAAAIYFRHYALILLATCVISAMAAEWLCNLIMKRTNSLGDLSAAVTGIILAFSLPPSFPFWAAIIGTVFAIAIGKMVFGGLGANTFNPAMVGRAFLTASFGMLMTTWIVPATIDPAMPVISAAAVQSDDIRTQATPLAISKEAIKQAAPAKETFDKLVWPIFKGEVGGCLGETSALALLIGGIYMLFRKTISFDIPLAVLLAAFVFAEIVHLIDPSKYIAPWTHLFSGGLIFGAFFIATDPVTAPLTRKGMWIFGIGVGALTMLIRVIGEYPGGIMYSVLLMNALTPLIDRFCKVTPIGGKPRNA